MSRFGLLFSYNKAREFWAARAVPALWVTTGRLQPLVLERIIVRIMDVTVLLIGLWCRFLAGLGCSHLVLLFLVFVKVGIGQLVIPECFGLLQSVKHLVTELHPVHTALEHYDILTFVGLFDFEFRSHLFLRISFNTSIIAGLGFIVKYY